MSLSETRRKSPGKRPAGGQRTCCWAAKGRREGFKGSLGRREGFLRAAKGAGNRVRAAHCLTSLSETRRNSSGKRPAGGQGQSFFSGALPLQLAGVGGYIHIYIYIIYIYAIISLLRSSGWSPQTCPPWYGLQGAFRGGSAVVAAVVKTTRKT